MVSVDAVWDRTVEVMHGRAATLASIAAVTLWLPTVLRGAVALALAGSLSPPRAPTAGAQGLLFVLALAGGALAILGQLALVAAASDPAVGWREALRMAAGRLRLAIGLALLIGLLAFVLLIPAIAPLVAAIPAGTVLTSDNFDGFLASLAPATRLFIRLYLLLFVVGMLWLTARLTLLLPVIANENKGTGSFARSFALTRGTTLKIIGLLLLIGVVSWVVWSATQSVVGIVLTLLLGIGHSGLAALITAAAVAVVTAVLTILWASFAARLYAAQLQVAVSQARGAA